MSMRKKVAREFLILGVFCALSLSSACTTVVENNRPSEAAPALEMSKIAVDDPNKLDVASINWGLKIRNFSELFLVSGYGATDVEGKVQFPGDAVAQTEFILGRIESLIESAGYSKDNIIRFETTVTQDVPPSQFSGIFAATSAFHSDVIVKPTAATFRVVQALGNPDMLVELEFWLAQ